MSVLVDAARWPAHGRLWAHLVSDSSLAELHAFAAALGVPFRLHCCQSTAEAEIEAMAFADPDLAAFLLA